jgi:hypothetical protein
MKTVFIGMAAIHMGYMTELLRMYEFCLIAVMGLNWSLQTGNELGR